jgi:uncharacterized protein YdeI (YjbR/CyaY-like superfamily)
VVKALAGGDSQIDKDVGDTVTVTVARDESKRAVTVPADLAAVLRSATLRKTFDALSYSHQREYVIWIDDAKRADTRARRIAQTVERLKG